ncbi:MAG: hypothetical protein IMW99_00590 [Firmicutes bacterium]|nr:hypothetical protein [Bacillota bacterium]
MNRTAWFRRESLRGVLRKGKRTKDLVKILRPGEIAVVDHADLDEVAADGLIQAKVQAVVNVAPSITGRFPNHGPGALLGAGIPLLDWLEAPPWETIPDGGILSVTRHGDVSINGQPAGKVFIWDKTAVEERLAMSQRNLAQELDHFVENTLDYARREKSLIIGSLDWPRPVVPIRGRHCLVVTRGASYREDLQTIQSYIAEVRPVLIAVDGGADGLREFGWQPDILVGDMDSVSDEALRAARQRVVHAYPDGRAPGMERVRKLGLSASTVAAPGTSEDLALLMAYDLGASLIVAVGSHSSMIDFLEKGRAGMGSTFLTRLKVGSILVDARGVSQLYREPPRNRIWMPLLIGAGVLPVILVAAMSEPVRQFGRLVVLWARLTLGW